MNFFVTSKGVVNGGIEDKEAFPVSGGFSWIHLMVASITKTEIIENESQTTKDYIHFVWVLSVFSIIHFKS